MFKYTTGCFSLSLGDELVITNYDHNFHGRVVFKRAAMFTDVKGNRGWKEKEINCVFRVKKIKEGLYRKAVLPEAGTASIGGEVTGFF